MEGRGGGGDTELEGIQKQSGKRDGKVVRTSLDGNQNSGGRL